MGDYQKGRTLLEQGDLYAAQKIFQAGISNDPKCYYGLLVVAIKRGEDLAVVAEQLHEVIPILEAMAQNDDTDACFILGRCSENGVAMAQSLPGAIAWYTTAAGLGCADAVFNLGCIYMAQGLKSAAVKYFERAARMGCIEAKRAKEHFDQTHQKEVAK